MLSMLHNSNGLLNLAFNSSSSPLFKKHFISSVSLNYWIVFGKSGSEFLKLAHRQNCSKYWFRNEIFNNFALFSFILKLEHLSLFSPCHFIVDRKATTASLFLPELLN